MSGPQPFRMHMIQKMFRSFEKGRESPAGALLRLALLFFFFLFTLARSSAFALPNQVESATLDRRPPVPPALFHPRHTRRRQHLVRSGTSNQHNGQLHGCASQA